MDKHVINSRNIHTGGVVKGRIDAHRGRWAASYTVEASVIMSVILLATGSIICFSYRQKAGVVAAYKTRFQEEYTGHEDENYCPEEYMRQMTIWDGLKEAYLRSKETEAK